MSVPTAARRQVLIGCMLTLALAAMDSTIVSTAIPSIAHDVGHFAMYPWVFSAYLLTSAATVPVYGKLADLYGRRVVLIAGTVLFLAGSMLSGTAWSMVTLIIFRAVQGLGAGAIQPVTATILGDLYSVEERGRVQGWLSSVWGISAVIGPAIGGFFVEYATWRWIFYINLPIGAAALFMINRHLRESVVRRAHRIDVTGAVLLTLGVGLAVLGLLEAGVSWSWASPASAAVFGSAVLVLCLFVWVESRATEPVLPLWVFRQRVLLGSNLAGAAVGLLTIGLVTFLPTFAQNVLGTSALIAGFTLSAMSVGWPLASSQSAKIYLRLGFRDTAAVGAVFCIASSVWFWLLPESAQVWELAAGSFLMGVGLGLFSTSLLVGVQSLVGWERRGVVTGSMMFVRVLGQAIGAAAFGALAHSASSATEGHGLYLAVHRVFLGLIVAAVLGLIVLTFTPRRFRPLEFPEDRPAETGAPAEPARE